MSPVPRTLILTGHFPPSVGGVQHFTWELARRLPNDHVVVVAPRSPGDAAFDATLPFPVVRRRGYLLSLDLARVVAEHGCTAAWIPAAAPIGLFAPSLRRAGVERIVASTHGQELGWLKTAPTRGALREISRHADALTYLTEWSAELLRTTVNCQLHQLRGGVDCDVFSPGTAHISAHPRVITIGRLVRRKGQDSLIRAWPRLLVDHPSAMLTIVGDGPFRADLERLATGLGVRDSVEFTGRLSQPDLVEAMRWSDVLVTPSRDDRHGLQTEGLGLVTLEGSAAGLPVVVGRSGGSSDSLVDGTTGYLVDATPSSLAVPIGRLLADRRLARRMGAAGRSWVQRSFSWDESARRLFDLLAGRSPDAAQNAEVSVGKMRGVRVSGPVSWA